MSTDVMTLAEFRKALGVTQTELAKRLGCHQSDISQFENRKKRKLSTVRRYIEALGANLEVAAVFRNKRISKRRRITLRQYSSKWLDTSA